MLFSLQLIKFSPLLKMQTSQKILDIQGILTGLTNFCAPGGN
jgi:hypothetical protein